jgi:hypothetical protein
MAVTNYQPSFVQPKRKFKQDVGYILQPPLSSSQNEYEIRGSADIVFVHCEHNWTGKFQANCPDRTHNKALILVIAYSVDCGQAVLNIHVGGAVIHQT